MHKIILIFILYSMSYFPQQKDLSVFISAGWGSDNDAIGSFGGGGAGLQVWYNGPVLRLGAEYELNKTWSTQGFVTYSFYKYDGKMSFGEKTSTGYNNIFEVLGTLKWNIGIFYMNFGIGISHQFNDEIRYLEENQFHKAVKFIDSKRKTVIAGLFAPGFDIHIYDRFSLLVEGDLFFREYLGSGWLLGVKYSLVQL